jgi:hypothetical protein
MTASVAKASGFEAIKSVSCAAIPVQPFVWDGLSVNLVSPLVRWCESVSSNYLVIAGLNIGTDSLKSEKY